METDERDRGRARAAVAAAWVIAIAVLAAVRYRGEWGPVREWHRWLAERGVPQFLRNLDYPLLVFLAIGLALGLARVLTDVRPREALGLSRGRRGWESMVAVSALPMVVGGLLVGLGRGWPALSTLPGALLQGVAQAPLVEETLFRGLLVMLPMAVLGDRPRVFWPAALASGVLFGLVHAPWTAAGLAAAQWNVLITGIGGVWLAWLLRRWQSLFVPLSIHAAMNLGWWLAQSAGGAAGGGLIENLLRAGTIAIATAWTARACR